MKMPSIKSCLLLAVVAAVASGCVRRVLSQKDMTDVLFDVHLAEATIKIVNPRYECIEYQEYYNSVFEKHGITKADFDRSLEWYAHHPEKLSIIYDSLKVRADEFQKRVEAYEFHPDEKPTHADSIGTFDLWHWQREQRLEATARRAISLDSLHFEINDTDYFARANEIDFHLRMRALSADTAEYCTRLIFCYNDSLADTLSHRSFADTLTRRFHFYKLLPDTVDVQRMKIELIDFVGSISRVEIDSVELIRVFNKFSSPIAPRIRREVSLANDSIKKMQKANLERAVKKKKNKQK